MAALLAFCRRLLAILALRGPFWDATRARWCVRLGVYLYAAVLLGLYLAQDVFVFPGAFFANYWREPYAELWAEEVWLKAADGRAVLAWWCAPAGWSPKDGAILYSHGNGSNLSKRQGAIVRWRRATGRAVLVYDYPGFGKSPGRPTEPGCYSAGEAALG